MSEPWESARVAKLARYWKNPQMAEDMAQEMRISLWQGNNMNAAFCDALDQSRIKKYAYKNSREYVPHISYGDFPDYLVVDESAEGNLIDQIFYDEMRNAVSLTPVERSVLTSRLEGYCFREIGEQFARSESWACKSYHRCLDKFKEYILRAE